MHVPDGFLNAPTLIATNAVMFSALAPAIRRINRELSPERIPLMGVAAAFVFAVQLIRFPIPGGTTAHISGAVLIAVLLGPFTGLAIITAALFLQALLFGHGGLLTLGANVMNIGVIGCLLGYGVYRILPTKSNFGAGVAAWIATLLAALACAAELGYSGRMDLETALVGMGGAHSILGVVEALVTMAVLSFLGKIRPDLLEIEKV